MASFIYEKTGTQQSYSSILQKSKEDLAFALKDQEVLGFFMIAKGNKISCIEAKE